MPFTVRISDAPEIEQGDDAAQVALENARRKATAAHWEGVAEAVIGCDTIVVLDGTIYGKPPDEAAARATISALGGRTHEVISGLALLLCEGGAQVKLRTAVARTQVSFRELDAEFLDWYAATGEWRDRSGGYAIQGRTGERLAVALHGEEENVVGLPLGTLLALYPELSED